MSETKNLPYLEPMLMLAVAAFGVGGISAQGAAISLNSDGTLRYNPTGSSTIQALSANQPLTDTFDYTIRDSSNNAATASVSVTVKGVNDAPTLFFRLLG